MGNLYKGIGDNMIDNETLAKYGLPTLEQYIAEHGTDTDTEVRFYHKFLDRTDYVVIKAIENNLSIPENLKEFRQFARNRINELGN